VHVAVLLCALVVCLSSGVVRGSISGDPPAGDPPPTLAAEAGSGAGWQHELPAVPVADGVADADRLFLSLDGGELISLARETGTVIWTQRLPTRWPPLVTGDTLLVASDTALHELDAATGTERRASPLPSPPSGPLAALGRGVVLPLASGVVAAFDAAGRTLWTAATGDASRISVGTREEREFVYVALDNGRLAALRGADGAVIWTREVGGTLTAPAVQDNRVYVGSTTRAVHAFDARSGRLLWSVLTGGDVVGTSADEESLYVVALDNVVRALHLSRGSLTWKRVLPTRPLSGPVRAGPRLLMGGVRPQLLAFDARTGDAVTSFTLPPELELAMLAGSPIVFAESPESHVAVALVTRDRRIIGLALDPPPVAAGSSDVEQTIDDEDQKTIAPTKEAD
jgi:outer membrane protein assembly factor BamB